MSYVCSLRLVPESYRNSYIFGEVWDHVHVNRQIKFDNGRRKTQQVTADARKNVTALSQQNSRVKKSLPIDIRKLLQTRDIL